jgi:hypothetical protein
LELGGSDGGFGPGVREGFGVGDGHWDCGDAVCVIVARDFVYAAGVDGAAGLVCVDVCTMVEDDV